MDMATGIGLSVLLGIVPMAIYASLLTLFDRFEREPPLLMLGVFAWGLIVAAGSALVLNTLVDIGLILVLADETRAGAATAVLVAPPVEETVKGLAVLAVFLFFRHEFDSLLDGVIYGSLVGFGFAAAENINYIFTGFMQTGLEGLLVTAFIRAIVMGFLHATLTAFTGLGLAVSRLSSGRWRYAAPLLGFLTAVTLHAFHNLLGVSRDVALCLLGSAIDWLGFLGMFAFILVLMWREGKLMREHLLDEVRLGHLTSDQYQSACSLSGQLAARWSALAGGHGRQVGRLYDLCGELAFKKYQLARLGHEREQAAQSAIDDLRQRLLALRNQP